MEDLKKLEGDERERRKLLEIFPEELWVQVFKSCGSDTLVACSNASFFLRELLETKRSLYLLPNVLTILAEQKCITRDHSADLLQLRLVCKNWRLGVNALLEAPPTKTPLHFENYRHNRTKEVAHPTYFRLYLSDPTETWDKLESELLPQLDSPVYRDGSSPFPSRTIEICGSRRGDNIPRPLRPRPEVLNNRRQWERNLSLLEILLKKGGHHFWSATLSFGERHNITPWMWYQFLCKFVLLMPNLKSLYVINSDLFRDVWLDGINEGLSFPELKNLELVSMENVSKSVMKSIICANTNVSVCIISHIPGIITGNFQGVDLDPLGARRARRLRIMRNLREQMIRGIAEEGNILNRQLRARDLLPLARNLLDPPAEDRVAPPAIRFPARGPLGQQDRHPFELPAGVFRRAQHENDQTESYDFGLGSLHDPQILGFSFRDPDYFQKLPEHWNLKVLRLNLTACSTLKLPQIFKKLESYKRSLTEVQISVAEATSEDDKLILWETSRTPLHLPQLTKLEMEVRNICSLDFLLGLMSLECLVFEVNHIETTPPSRGSNTQRIDFQNWYENRSEFMKCNIWNYIPSLKQAKIKFPHTSHSYRRGDTP